MSPGPTRILVPSLLLALMAIPTGAAPGDGGVELMGALEDYVASSTGLPTTSDFFFVVLADVNDDGFRDIVSSVSNYSSRSTMLGLRVYTCKGGTSWEDNSSGLPTVDRYGGIGVGDMDGDGDLDIASGIETNEGSSNEGVRVWLNNGTVGGKLSWKAGPTPSTRWQYCTVTVADIDADGDGDLIAGGKSGIGIDVYKGNGGAGGALQWTDSSTGLPTSSSYTGLAVADMNSDGDLDIVATDYQNSGNNVQLWTGDGTGRWTSRVSSMPAGTDLTMGVAVDDFDLDGNNDIVYGTRDAEMMCLLGNGGGSDGASFCWTSADTGLPTTGGWGQISTGDVDKDGDPDVLAGCSGRALELYLSDGGVGGTLDWTKASKGLPTGNFYAAALGDFDGDRVLDVVGGLMASRTAGGLRAYRGAVTGESYPVAKAVWNGTAANETTVVLGVDVEADGRGSYDAEDAPAGDAGGTALVYDWNLTQVPALSALGDANLTPNDANATPSFRPDALGDYALTLVVRDSDRHWSEVAARLVLHVLKPNEPPVADAGADQVVTTGASVELNGTASRDPDGEIDEWEWNASALNPAAVALAGNNTTVASFTAGTVGLYAFTLRIRDDNGSWSAPDEVTVTVELPPNTRPIANAGVDVGVREGEPVELDGSASYDPDGTIAAWEWDCTSHPGLALVNNTTARVSFVPAEAGDHTLALRVQDDRGDWSPLDTVTVRVVGVDVNLPPVADIEGPTVVEAFVGDSVALSGATSRDPDGTVVEWTWNCTTHAVTFAGQGTATASFVPAVAGYLSITLAVRDDNGTWSLSEDAVVVGVAVRPNVPPAAVITGPSGTVMTGDTVTIDGSDSYDPDGTIAVWLWHCSPPSGVGFYVQGTSRIVDDPRAGTYTYTLWVTDDQGAQGPPATLTFTVVQRNRPPAVRSTLPVAGGQELENGTLLVAWEASDPDGDELEYAIEVMDGAAVVARASAAPGANRTALLDSLLHIPRNVTLTVRVRATERSTFERLNATASSAAFRIVDPAPPPPPPPPPPPDDEPDVVTETSAVTSRWSLIALAALVVAGVVGGVILVVSRSSAGAPMQPPAAVWPQSAVGTCPACGSPIGTDNAFGRPYCPRCDRYY